MNRLYLPFIRLVFPLFFSSGLLTYSAIYAQSDTLKALELEEVLVTATRTEKHVFDVGRSVSVIDRQDIERGMYQNVAEALLQEAGIHVIGSGQTPGSLQNLYLRGSNNNHTVFMIDGIRITDPSSTDNNLDLSELSLQNIDRIEIVRGSHSTLYGSSAIGGVVNIITRGKQSPGFNVDAELRGGTFGKGTATFSQRAYLNYSAGSGLYLSAEIQNTDVRGLDSTVDTISAANRYKAPDTDDFHQLALSAKTGFHNEKWNLSAAFRRTDQKADIDDGAFMDDENYVLRFDRNLLTYGVTYHLNDKTELSFRGGWSDLLRFSVDDSSRVDAAGNFDHAYSEDAFEGTLFNNEIQANFTFPEINLVFGAGRYEEQMSAQNYYLNTAWDLESETDLDTLGIGSHTHNMFGQLDIGGAFFASSLQALHLLIGGRWNRHSSFGNQFNYEMNLTYQFNQAVTAYLSAASGFNAPSLYQLYAPAANYLSGISRGNEGLGAETSTSYEAGLKTRFGNHLRARLAFFQTRVNNAIDYVYLWDAGVPIDSLGNDWMRDDYRGDTYLNIGTQTNRGIELSAEAVLTPQFSLSGNVSITHGKVDYQPENVNAEHTQGNHVQLFTTGAFLTEEVETNGLVRRANTANLQLTFQPSEWLSTNLHLRHAGPRQDIYYESSLGPYGALATTGVDGYTLLNWSARAAIGNQLAATLLVENLFNTSYQEIRGYTARGRGVYLRLQYSIN